MRSAFGMSLRQSATSYYINHSCVSCKTYMLAVLATVGLGVESLLVAVAAEKTGKLAKVHFAVAPRKFKAWHRIVRFAAPERSRGHKSWRQLRARSGRRRGLASIIRPPLNHLPLTLQPALSPIRLPQRNTARKHPQITYCSIRGAIPNKFHSTNTASWRPRP